MSETDKSPHYPVLYTETLTALNIKPGGRYLDGTLGAGGHASGILAASAPDGKLLALDADPVAHRLAAERLQPFADRVTQVESNFAEMAEVAEQEGFVPLDGIVLDLGVSSMQLDDMSRGFSFRGDGALDMRFGVGQGKQTAAIIVNNWTEEQLAKLFFTLGEDPQSRRLARAIVEERKKNRFTTTTQLAELAVRTLGMRPAGREKRPIHPATRMFQALRMEVNQELPRLHQGLSAAVQIMASGARLAVITFHSLEDREVKHFMQHEAAGSEKLQPGLVLPKEKRLKIITKKPIEASENELNENRRSRSAKLRIAEKI